eukprot:5169753-Amphidinium_carterae.1
MLTIFTGQVAAGQVPGGNQQDHCVFLYFGRRRMTAVRKSSGEYNAGRTAAAECNCKKAVDKGHLRLVLVLQPFNAHA